MRFLNKYKIHGNFASASKKLPLRIVKFNRPKWAKIKNKVVRIKKQPFVNVLINKLPFKSISRVKKYYKVKLQTKKYISSLFDNTINFKKNSSFKLKKDLICAYLVKPLFRIDILLWYLNYFSSSFESRQNINSKKVLVNEETIKANYFIKKGDIISLNFRLSFEKSHTYNSIKKKYVPNKMFFSFLEYDYYTNTIIVLKDLKDLTIEDLRLLIEESMKVKNILYK